MSGDFQHVALRARWVFPVASAPVRDGVVTIEGERILAVGTRPPGDIPACDVHDLGNAAILPGLVNAHTHLEFSRLEQPLGEPGMPFPDWIRCVMHHRYTRQLHEQPQDTSRAQLGLEQCRRAGTTTVGNITSGRTGSLQGAGDENRIEFFELIGLRADRVQPALAMAEQFLSQARPGNTWQPALSPHAPYSVRGELLAKVVQLASSKGLPLAMHLAESPEELRLLRSQDGPFRELLVDLDAWDPLAIAAGTRPLDYLRQLAAGPRALVIHGNYLDDEEIGFVAAHAHRMAVVYCPRTHAYFAHARHPLARLLAAGATVALGTDSRASNPDLSLLEELRLVARTFAEIPGDVVLQLGTLGAARALGWSGVLGSLEAGKYADLAVVGLPRHDAADPHELLFDSNESVRRTIFRGRVVYTVP